MAPKTKDPRNVDTRRCVVSTTTGRAMQAY